MSESPGPPLRPFGELTRNFDATRVPVKKSDRKPGPYPYYGASGVVDHVDGFLFDGEYLLVAEDGENLRTRQTPIAFLARGKFWVNNHAHIVQGNDENDTRYLMYAVRVADVTAYLTGSAMPKLTQGNLNRVPVLAPSLSNQRAIASVLGSLDDKIEQNRRTARALERLARAIFRAWFVDFEPVKAKAAGAASFPSMPQDAFDALPINFIDSELGPVPEGWGVGKLGDCCHINQRTVRSGEIDGEIEYVDISSVTVGRLTGVQRVPFAEAPSRARRRVGHGDTIWSCVRPNHKSYLFIHSPPERRIVSTGFAVMSPGEFGASFLHEVTTQPEFVHYLVSNADGSAYPAVRADHFASATVTRPPKQLRDAFEALTMPLRDLFASAELEAAQLAEVRDYLLPLLLTGQVPVEVGDA